MAGINVRVLPDERAAAATAAAEIANAAREAVAARGTFHLAVSGGRSPWLMLRELDQHAMPWAATTIFQVDERIGTPDDPLRNLHGLLDSLPLDCPARLAPMPVTEADLEAAAQRYAAALPDQLDMVHLGLGPDGHTASLIPGDPVLDVTDRDIALTGQYQQRRRMTMTYPRLQRVRKVLWLVTGAEKAPALAALLAGDRSIPAGRIATADQVLFCDLAAHGSTAG